MDDLFDLERFVAAQAAEFDQVSSELSRGRKVGHWIWFIFPQLKGLGSSWAANHYGIASLTEAAAYLEHPVLGPRLLQCTELLNNLPAQPIEQILGGIDAMKFRSSMTLFAQLGPHRQIFEKALARYFGSEPDQLTLARLGRRPKAAEV